MKKRWQESLEQAAASLEVQMPWARGARRADMIARRNSDDSRTDGAPDEDRSVS